MDKDLLKAVYDKVKAENKGNVLVLINSIDDYSIFKLDDVRIEINKKHTKVLKEEAWFEGCQYVSIDFMPDWDVETIHVGDVWNIQASIKVANEQSAINQAYALMRSPERLEGIFIYSKMEPVYPYLPINDISCLSLNSDHDRPYNMPVELFVDDTPIYNKGEWKALKLAS